MLGGALAILAAGALVVLAFAALSNQFGLGLDLASRLAFLALVGGAFWPWLGDERTRAFDPRAIPSDLLPR